MDSILRVSLKSNKARQADEIVQDATMERHFNLSSMLRSSLGNFWILVWKNIYRNARFKNF